MTKKTDNPDSTSKSISERLNDLLPNFRKLFNSTAAAVLLLPNIMSVGVVAAEEPTSGEEPPVGEFSDASDETQTTPEDTHITGTTADLETTNLQATPQEETPTEPVAAEAAEESVAPAQIIEDEFYPIGFEVRGLDGTRTNDVRIYVQDENFTVYTGSFNEYGQWQSDEALPVGEYTVTLVTPQNTYAVVSDAANNAATPTEKTNVFTFSVNEESRGNLSRIYGSFRLVERSYRLGVEVRGLDGRRTDDVTVWVQNEDFTVFEGSYNEYGQWLTNAELTAGQYTITLDTPDNTYAVINPTTPQYAFPTDEENIFTIELNEENLGTSSAIYGAFQLEEMGFTLGVEVRDLDGRRTNDVTVWVQDDDFTVFEGSFNEYNQWKTEAELPAGEYTITLVTPENTYAVINDTTAQYAVPTDEENVFTIVLNEENLGTSSAIYGAFRLEEFTSPIGIEIRGLNDRRTDEVGITLTDEDGNTLEGSYDEWYLWTSADELPVGTYTVTLNTPEGTVAVVNEEVHGQVAVPTDTPNVFTITVNEENRGALSRVFGAFILDEIDEVIDIDDLLERIEELERRLDELETANAELEAELARLRAQLAELQADQAAAEERIAELERRIAELEARLAELENQEEPEEPEAPIEDDDNDEEPTDPAEPALPGDNGEDDDDDTEDPSTPETPVDDQDDDEDDLPETGIAPSTLGLGITTLLSGLGLAFIEKKRRK